MVILSEVKPAKKAQKEFRLKIAVCAHDAGGANLILSWAKRAHRHVDIQQWVKGPAKKIFNDTFKTFEGWSGVNYLVSGTGWQTDFERHAIQEAKCAGVMTVAYLDHWVNYEERFKDKGNFTLPDQLWCADSQANDIVRFSEMLGSLPRKTIGNYYWRDVYSCMPSRQPDSILIIHEPIRDKNVDQTLLVKQCVDALASYPENSKVVFRVHPSGLDSFGQKLIDALRNKYRCELSTQSLPADISSAILVIGYVSIVLAMVANMGKPAVSFFSGEKPGYLTRFGVK